MKKTISVLSILVVAGFSALTAGAQQPSLGDNLGSHKTDNAPKTTVGFAVVPDADNAGLKLPAGFGALRVAENVGRSRHIVATPQGDLYVKLDRAVNGKGVLLLHSSKDDGKGS